VHRGVKSRPQGAATSGETANRPPPSTWPRVRDPAASGASSARVRRAVRARQRRLVSRPRPDR